MMFSVLFNVLWVSMLVGGIYTGVTGLLLYLTLKKYNLNGEYWKGIGGIKGLEKLEQNIGDEMVKRSAHKAIGYLRASRMIMQLGFLAIVLLVMLNAFLSS